MRWTSDGSRYELQLSERRLLREGEAVPLRPLTFDVLAALVERAGHLVTKEELLRRVWGKVIVEENTLQAQISALRKLLGAEAIATLSGQGYRFTHEAAPAPEPMVAAPKHNLPQALTSFIGREREVQEIRRWLGTTRLLTLAGSGGCGKTRLALQVAASMVDEVPDGVWLVELAPLSDPRLLAQAVAKSLAVEEQSGRELVETVADWLAPRQLLLVLDNAEHLIEACARLADKLLRHCARLVILVTSRERLGIDGELTYRVPSLSLPHGHAGEDVLASEAARLFIDRARLLQPDFEVTTRDAAALASICHRLDGIALAIELAAPRVRAMRLEELSKRLDDRFAVLTGGSRTALPRHRTLRALIDWSHELLREAERAVLRRASVFAGGWTLEASERVCSGNAIGRAEVLDLLTSLADKNLVVAETQGDETRFGLLETVRHYALERLRECGEEGPARDRHVEHFLGLAEQLREDLSDADLQDRLHRFDHEDDNVRAALARCAANPANFNRGLMLAGQLHLFWMVRGRYGEGRDWVTRLLHLTAGGCDRGETHARALRTAGMMAYVQGDAVEAEVRFREALGIWQQLGDRTEIAESLGYLGDALLSRRDATSARALYEQSLALARASGNRRSMARTLMRLGRLAYASDDLESSEACHQECASIAGELGRMMLRDQALLLLGRVRHVRGDVSGARALLTEALQGFRSALRDRLSMAHVLTCLGAASRDAGDSVAARAQLAEALASFHEQGNAVGCAQVLKEFASLSLTLAGPIASARLFGATERVLKGRDLQARVEQERYEAQVAAARGAFNDAAAFDRAWAEGQSWSLEEAVRYALGL